MRYEYGRVTLRRRNRLPHLDVEAGVQFVTFNLWDAIPSQRRAQIDLEARVQLDVIERARARLTPADVSAVAAWKRRQLQRCLDEGHGSALLRNPRAAEVVADAIRHIDGSHYDLLCWCVMPNHAHIVYSVTSSDCGAVMHSIKGYTAHQVNKVLGRVGKLWQDDYFDRLVRTSEQLERIVRYVLRNPSDAGLADWPYVGTCPENLARAAFR